MDREIKKVTAIKLLLLAIVFPWLASGQTAAAIEITDSEYVVVPFDDYNAFAVRESGLKFINTKSGAVSREMLPAMSYVARLSHIRIDLLEINKV
ncbi:MAG: hypothetical protein EOO01_09865, partial [Chitinophagaceae bacterium]